MLDDLPLDQPLPFRSASGDECLDLNALLAPNPLSTFYMRVAGHGLRSRGVLDGDLLVIDRSIQPRPGCLVVVAHQGAFLLRPLLRDGEGRCWLGPLHPGERHLPVEVDDIHESPLFGVAVHGVHRLAPAASRRR
jgi:DNA polymerase V